MPDKSSPITRRLWGNIKTPGENAFIYVDFTQTTVIFFRTYQGKPLYRQSLSIEMILFFMAYFTSSVVLRSPNFSRMCVL